MIFPKNSNGCQKEKTYIEQTDIGMYKKDRDFFAINCHIDRKTHMLKKVLFSLSILLHLNVYCEQIESILRTNYMQVDGFLFDEQITSADKQEYSGSTNQIFTARPALAFYFNFDSYIFRPKIVINPFDSSTEGSVAFGKIFNKEIEFGFYTLFNRDQKVLGAENQQNETIKTDFSIGPYLVFYPYFSEKYFFELLTRISYVYESQQMTIFGSNDLISDKKGVSFYSNLFYNYKLATKITFSPNIVLNYMVTADTGGANTVRNQFNVQFLPLSLRVSL